MKILLRIIAMLPTIGLGYDDINKKIQYASLDNQLALAHQTHSYGCELISTTASSRWLPLSCTCLGRVESLPVYFVSVFKPIFAALIKRIR